jgi:hypothetical protein
LAGKSKEGWNFAVKPIVAFDLDNVVVDIIAAAKNVVAAMVSVDPDEIIVTDQYNTPFTHSHPEMAKALVVTHDFWQRDDLLASCVPIEGSLEALWKLYEANQLRAYVTRRSTISKGITDAWLDLHGYPPVHAYHVGHCRKELNYEACKAEICLELGATHLVDDSQKEAQSAITKGVIPVLVDHPLGRSARYEWLKSYPSVGIVKNAAEAVDLLMK